MNEWTEEWNVSEWLMKKWINEQMNEWMNEWAIEWKVLLLFPEFFKSFWEEESNSDDHHQGLRKLWTNSMKCLQACKRIWTYNVLCVTHLLSIPYFK